MTHLHYLTSNTQSVYKEKYIVYVLCMKVFTLTFLVKLYVIEKHILFHKISNSALS